MAWLGAPWRCQDGGAASTSPWVAAAGRRRKPSQCCDSPESSAGVFRGRIPLPDVCVCACVPSHLTLPASSLCPLPCSKAYGDQLKHEL